MDFGMANISRSKPSIRDLNPHLVCHLCCGYFIDATTIVECLHTFCRSCIVRYLDSSKYCPVCDVQVHKTKPLLNIRPDKTLQTLVYKLVPRLLHHELKRRRDFALAHHTDEHELRQHLVADQLAHADLFTHDEPLSVVLRQCTGADNSALSVQVPCTPSVVRYFKCPAAFTIAHIRKLIRNKFGLDDRRHLVRISYHSDWLHDHLTLMDVAYIYSWKRKCPIELTFELLQYAPKRRKLDEPKTLSPTPVVPAVIAVSDQQQHASQAEDDLCNEVQLRISENGEMSATTCTPIVSTTVTPTTVEAQFTVTSFGTPSSHPTTSATTSTCTTSTATTTISSSETGTGLSTKKTVAATKCLPALKLIGDVKPATTIATSAKTDEQHSPKGIKRKLPFVTSPPHNSSTSPPPPELPPQQQPLPASTTAPIILSNTSLGLIRNLSNNHPLKKYSQGFAPSNKTTIDLPPPPHPINGKMMKRPPPAIINIPKPNPSSVTAVASAILNATKPNKLLKSSTPSMIKPPPPKPSAMPHPHPSKPPPTPTPPKLLPSPNTPSLTASTATLPVPTQSKLISSTPSSPKTSHPTTSSKACMPSPTAPNVPHLPSSPRAPSPTVPKSPPPPPPPSLLSAPPSNHPIAKPWANHRKQVNNNVDTSAATFAKPLNHIHNINNNNNNRMKPPLPSQQPSLPQPQFSKIRNNQPRYLGNPASGVKPMYPAATEPQPHPPSANNVSIRKHSIVKIDPKTLRPITEKAPPSSTLTTTAAVGEKVLSAKSSNPTSITTTTTSTVAQKPHHHNNAHPYTSNSSSSTTINHNSNTNATLPSPKPFNFTLSNPFIPNSLPYGAPFFPPPPCSSANSSILNCGPNITTALPGISGAGSFPPYDPRFMQVYHNLLYGQRMAAVAAMAAAASKSSTVDLLTSPPSLTSSPSSSVPSVSTAPYYPQRRARKNSPSTTPPMTTSSISSGGGNRKSLETAVERLTQNWTKRHTDNCADSTVSHPPTINHNNNVVALGNKRNGDNVSHSKKECTTGKLDDHHTTKKCYSATPPLSPKTPTQTTTDEVKLMATSLNQKQAPSEEPTELTPNISKQQPPPLSPPFKSPVIVIDSSGGDAPKKTDGAVEKCDTDQGNKLEAPSLPENKDEKVEPLQNKEISPVATTSMEKDTPVDATTIVSVAPSSTTTTTTVTTVTVTNTSSSTTVTANT